MQSGWQMIEPKPPERSRDVYRLRVRVPARRALVQQVVEEKTRQEQYTLASADVDTVKLLLHHGASSPRLKEAVRHAFDLRGQWQTAQREVEILTYHQAEIKGDESRVRANIVALPAQSAAHQRAIDKLDALERDIDAGEQKLKAARAVLSQRRKAYEDYLSGLTVEGTAEKK